MKKNKGFTLVEILVVISVTVLLSALLITYSRTGEQQILLFREQAKVINAVLRSKNLAIQAYAGGGNVCGYGTHFDAGDNAIIIFKDLTATDNCSDADKRYMGEVNEHFETYELSSLVKFSSDVADVVFIPPDVKVVFNPDGDLERQITISVLDDSSSVGIIINSAGQVTTD